MTCQRSRVAALAWLEAELNEANSCAANDCRACRQEAIVLTAVIQAYKDLRRFAAALNDVEIRQLTQPLTLSLEVRR